MVRWHCKFDFEDFKLLICRTLYVLSILVIIVFSVILINNYCNKSSKTECEALVKNNGGYYDGNCFLLDRYQLKLVPTSQDIRQGYYKPQ